MRDSVAAHVACQVDGLPVGSFLKISDVDGPRGAVGAALSRLVRQGKLVRVRRGWYWKGPLTVFGMLEPRVMDLGIAVGGAGSGPAGVAAAHVLGLTTQMPSVFRIAVPGPPPAPQFGLRFVQRPARRLARSLSPWEVAVLEVLRDGPAVMEAEWDEMADVTARLADAGEVRLAEIAAAVQSERHRLARDRWSNLCMRHSVLADVA